MAKSSRRDEMIQAGLQLIRTMPFREITLDHVAELTGTTRGLVLYYFKSRDNFMLELVGDYQAAGQELYGPAPDRPSSEWIVHEVDTFVRHVQQDTTVVETILFGMAGIPGVAEQLDSMTAFTADRVSMALGVEPGNSFLTPILQSWGRACVDLAVREHRSGQNDIERQRALMLGHLLGVLEVAARLEPDLAIVVPDFSLLTVGAS